MEAVTDVVFRHVVAQAARPDIFFTEFTNAASYASPKGIHSTRGRLTFTPDEQPMVAQIWGNNPEHFAHMARGLADMGYAGIDINTGCPDKSVVRQGSGSGLIGNYDLTAQLIAAAKEGGLPVSIKTRLGSTRVDEWRDWLSFLLAQDIANLTIHLRTRKEMSKVPAHYELIPNIKALRDELAPQTLLTINGDIRDRAHGDELVAQYGVDGIMIGRGIFQDPFAFANVVDGRWNMVDSETQPSSVGAKSSKTSAARTSRGAGALAEARREAVLEDFGGDDANKTNKTRHELLSLLHLHLDLHDKYSAELEPRRYDPLKRFFKIYIRDFPGASDLRDQLMHTKTTSEARRLLQDL